MNLYIGKGIRFMILNTKCFIGWHKPYPHQSSQTIKCWNCDRTQLLSGGWKCVAQQNVNWGGKLWKYQKKN